MILAEMCSFGAVLAELEFWMGCFGHDVSRLAAPRVSSDNQVLSQEHGPQLQPPSLLHKALRNAF